MRKTPKLESRLICDQTGHSVFEVTFTSTSGETVRRILTPEDYADLLGASLKETKRNFWRIRKDFLPEGFVDGCISDENNYVVAFKVKGCVRPFLHTSGMYQIPFPDLLFIVKMNKGRISGKEVYAMKKGDGDTLYQYPFGNVSTCGSICMGNIETSEIKENGPEMFAELFFLGKTNNDYFGEGSHINAKWSQEQLLQKLDGKKEFPERLLKQNSGFHELSAVREMIKKTAA